MKCRAELERERERLEHALKDLRNDMAGIHGRTPLRMYLDEANIQGQIKAIDYALTAEPGGWPHDAWFLYVEARKAAVLSLVKAGKPFDEILATLNITEVEARLLVKVEEPDTTGKN